MNILAFETATEACSVALLAGSQVRQRYQLVARAHARLVLPMADALLAEAALTPAQLDAVAFGRGPGAFTGVRIATAVAQGVALGSELTLLPVSTLATLALGSMRELDATRVAVALDARMGEIYWCPYQAEQGMPRPLTGERVCVPADVESLAGEDWLGVGSGWHSYEGVLSAATGVRAVATERYPQARDLVALAALALQAGQGCDPAQAQPVYLRDQVVKG